MTTEVKKKISETKRKLSEEEIEDILTIIAINKFIPKDVGISIRNNNAKKLRKQLENIMLYPKTIPHLKKEIEKQYIKTQIQPGESVGVITAQSIGERQTQLSVHSDEEIIVKYKSSIFEGKISSFIDELLEEESIDLIEHKNSKIRLVDNLDIYIQTVSEDEKVIWQKINEISRHPSNGKMIKIKTLSGREVTATLSHSFLKRQKEDDGTYKIVPIEGEKLKKGDRIPVIKHSPFMYEDNDKFYVDDNIHNTKYFYNFIACFLCSDEKSLNDDGTIYIKSKYLKTISDYCCFRIKYFEIKENKDETFIIKCESLYNFIKDNMVIKKEEEGICKYKIPTFFYNISKINFIKVFLNTFYLLNGFGENKNKGVFHKDKNIIKQLCFMYSFFGLSTYIFEKQGEFILYFSEISKKKSSQYIFWDPIISIKYTTTDKYVYDFSVPGNETFALKSGILVHNTLNSFHSAGLSIRTVVSGVPRFTELLNVSKDPKNTSCQVFFKKDSNKDINDDNTEINQVRNKIGHSIVSLNLNNINSEIKININKSREKWYNIFEKLFEKNKKFDLTHCISVTISKEKMIEYNLTLSYISSKIEDEFKETYCIFSPDFIGKIDIFVDMTNIEEDNEKEIFLEDTCLPNITKYNFCGIKGITDIFYDKKGNEWHVDSEGSNLRSFFAHPNVDMTRTISTNVWDIYNTLGIEAARKFLIEQFVIVISSDGTFVNNSHISLLVDIMTFSGMVVSISRYGLKKEACGPMAKASFEESLENFIKAGVFGETEKIIGVSASIIMGKQAKIGTGICDVLLDISNYVDNLNIIDTKKIIKSVIERKISTKSKNLSNKIEKEEDENDTCDLYSDNEEEIEEDKDNEYDKDEDIIDEDLELKEYELDEDKEDLDIEEVDDEIDCDDDDDIIDDNLEDY
jgi:DNA-directed RNA polymerase subunit A"